MDEQPITAENPVQASPVREAPVTPGTPERGDRRVFGRIKPYWVRCNLGYVLDISSDGIKVLTKRKLSGGVSLRLWDDRLGVNLQAEVIWARKIRWRQVEVGMKFLDPGPDVANTLAVIASNFHH